MRRRLALPLVVATAMWVLAPPAMASEQFLGVDLWGHAVVFSSAGGHVRPLPAIQGLGTIRVVGLDTGPNGYVLALDAAGTLLNVDMDKRVATPRFGLGLLAGYAGIESPSTFTVARDGKTALVVWGTRTARIDLSSGAVTAVPPIRTAASDGGRLTFPTLDTLPSERLVGVDWARPAIVAEAVPGTGPAQLGGVPVDWSGPTRFSLDPDGWVGWVVTRRADHRSELVPVNPYTGAVGPAVTLDDGIDAFVALGPDEDGTPQPPSGRPLLVPPAGNPAVPPDQFAAKVRLAMGAQSRARILRQRGLALSMTSSARVRFWVLATLGPRKVCASPLRVVDGSWRGVARCSPRQLRLLRTAPRDLAHRELKVTVFLRDTRGYANPRTRHWVLR